MITWTDIAGHERTLGMLRRAVREGRPHHAYLLLGPAGIGKLTIAALLARALACEAYGDAAPCGECSGCRKVAAGTHPDVWTESPGGKSHTITVDQVAEIQRRLSYRKAESEWRVVLIDGAGTMNDQAQNKLLKTLEEPPPGTVLVLCALHPSQLLVTVRSRCSKLALTPVPAEPLARWLLDHWPAPDAAAAADADTAGAAPDTGPDASPDTGDLDPLGPPDPELARAAAVASRGLPGLALTLLHPATLAARRDRVDGLCRALAGDRPAIDAVVKEIGYDREAGGEILGLLQELLRDAMAQAAAADVPPMHPGAAVREGRMAPLSVEHLADTVSRVEDAREKLSRNVHPGLLVEDVLLHVATRPPYP